MKKQPKKKNNKVRSEEESRASLLALAERFNCKGDILAILEKYDRALLRCTNSQERAAISTQGLVDLHNALSCRGALVINGVEVLPAAPDFVDPDQKGKFSKLS